MKRIVDTEEYLDFAAQSLNDGVTNVPVPVTGFSMAPFLREGDTVYLESADSDTVRGDIVLYRRGGGRYVLHRLCSFKRDGAVFLGDAQIKKEYLPDRRAICGRVAFCVRRGKRISRTSVTWRTFAAIWLAVVPLRPFIIRALGLKNHLCNKD